LNYWWAGTSHISFADTSHSRRHTSFADMDFIRGGISHWWTHTSFADAYLIRGGISHSRRHISFAEAYLIRGGISHWWTHISSAACTISHADAYLIRGTQSHPRRTSHPQTYASVAKVSFSREGIFQSRRYISVAKVSFSRERIFQSRTYISIPEVFLHFSRGDIFLFHSREVYYLQKNCAGAACSKIVPGARGGCTFELILL